MCFTGSENSPSIPDFSRFVAYDTIQWSILTCALKLTSSQLNLPHGTKQKKNNEETKNKYGDAQKKRSGREVHGVSPEAERESMVGKLCVKEVGLEAAVKERGSYGW